MKPKRASARFFRRRDSENCIDGEEKNAQFTFIWTAKDETSEKLILRYVDRTRRREEHTVSIDSWSHWPKLIQPFVYGLNRAWSKRASISVRGNISLLSTGWFEFLREQGTPADFGISEISNLLIGEFITWLSRRENSGEYRWRVSRRGRHLGTVRTVIQCLRANSSYRQLLQKDVHVPRFVWPTRDSPIEPTQPLSFGLLRRIYIACVNEVSSAITSYRLGRTLIEKVKEGDLVSNLKGRAMYRELDTCLATIDAVPGLFAQGRTAIGQHNRRLMQAIDKYHGGYGRVIRYFAPLSRDLVPFIILLGLQTSLNADTLLGLEKSMITYESSLGKKRIRFFAPKQRSKRKQRRTFPVDLSAIDNPANLVSFLLEWTQSLRPLCEPFFQNRLFLYVVKMRGPHAGLRFRGFESKTATLSVDVTWLHSFKVFKKCHRLPNFTLKQLRITGIDIVSEIFGNDLSILQAVSNHRAPQVLLDHYQSGMMRARDEERLGEIMAVRTRWVETQGRVDPRARPAGDDIGAATPGFTCLDPYNSPIPGNRTGALCRSYGFCPICPLAEQRKDDPYACACLHRLREALEVSQTTVPAVRWVTVWAPILAKIDSFWMPRFSGECRRQAADFYVTPFMAME